MIERDTSVEWSAFSEESTPLSRRSLTLQVLYLLVFYIDKY